jgi:hypothetical protein
MGAKLGLLFWDKGKDSKYVYLKFQNLRRTRTKKTRREASNFVSFNQNYHGDSVTETARTCM